MRAQLMDMAFQRKTPSSQCGRPDGDAQTQSEGFEGFEEFEGFVGPFEGLQSAECRDFINKFLDEVCAGAYQADDDGKTTAFIDFVSKACDEMCEFWEHSNRDAIEFLAFGSASVWLRVLRQFPVDLKHVDQPQSASPDENSRLDLTISQVEVGVFILPKLVSTLRTIVTTYVWSVLLTQLLIDLTQMLC
jgi:hypothetical protein